MSETTPDRLYISKNRRKMYDRLKESDSPVAKLDNKDLFMLSLTIGFREDNREKIDDRDGFIRVQYLSPRDMALIKSIAVKEKNDLEILIDDKEIFTIVEEYANGGIESLKNMVFEGGYGNFLKRLESELVEKIEKYKFVRNK